MPLDSRLVNGVQLIRLVRLVRCNCPFEDLHGDLILDHAIRGE